MKVEMKTQTPFLLIYLLAILAGCFCQPLIGRANAADLSTDLVKAVKDFDQAQIHSDIPTLTRLVAEDYVLVNSNATVENKQQFLADFNLPGFKIDPYVVEQPVQKIWDNGAVVGG